MNLLDSPTAPWGAPQFDEHQFVKRAKAITAESGIAWSDFQNMHTVSRRVQRQRKISAEDWCQSDETLRKVVLLYSERRLFLHTVVTSVPKDWTDKQRLEQIETVAKYRAGVLAKTIHRLIALHAAWQREKLPPLMMRKIEHLIMHFDTERVVLQRGLVATALSVTYAYFRRGLNATEVGGEMKLKPTCIRQIICRLRQASREVRHLERTLSKRRKRKDGLTIELRNALLIGMSEAEYLHRRSQLRSALNNLPMPLRSDYLRMQPRVASYPSFDVSEIVTSLKCGRATDVQWDASTGKIRLLRELTA